jgi:hypothetical protein
MTRTCEVKGYGSTWDRLSIMNWLDLTAICRIFTVLSSVEIGRQTDRQIDTRRGTVMISIKYVVVWLHRERKTVMAARALQGH